MHKLTKINLFQNARLWDQIKKPVFDLVDKEHASGMAQNSELVKRLETRLAEHFDRKHCVTFANCTDALVGACIALQLPDKARVAVSNYTFTASAHAIARAGYTPVPVDVNNNGIIDVSKIPTVDAVLVVDIFGNMSNWRLLETLGVPVINDAAQSLESHNGAMWSASYGDISCISFSPSKTVSSWGSGGALLTDNNEIASMARKLRLHGKIKNSDISIHPGMNSMLSSFEAACIWVGLDHSERWQKRRQNISKYLISQSKFDTVLDTNLFKNTYHKLVFKSDVREETRKHLQDLGVNTAVHYNLTINDEILYNSDKLFPVSDKLKATCFTVPNQQTLLDEEVEQIKKALI